MKGFILSLGLGLFSFTSFAAVPTVFEHVLRSEAFAQSVGDQNSMMSIVQTQTYRCIGCYQFEVKFYKQGDHREKLHSVFFYTRATDIYDANSITVSLKP